MKNSTFASYTSSSKLALLFHVLIAFGVITNPAFAQQTTISLGSVSSSPGGSAAINLSLTTSGGVQPAGLQWTMNYPAADISSVSVVAGASATAAGKSVTCSSSSGSTMCILFGVNTNVLGSGVAATATFNVSAGAPDPVASIQLTGVMASDANGTVIPSSGAGGTITILQPLPTISGISCAPATVNAPGSSTCSVTLSRGAPVGGFPVTLGSNNTAVSVPASALVLAGALSVPFVATVNTISANQTVVLTATNGSSSQTASLSLIAPLWSISGGVSSLGNGATITLGGTKSATVVADASGNYIFSGLANGSYTVTPSKAGFTFTPASRPVTINGANVTAVAFTAQTQGWTVSGTITPAASGAGTVVALNNGMTATADASGNFSFTGLANGTYIATPSKSGFTFAPATQSIAVNSANATAPAFVASAVAPVLTSLSCSPSSLGSNASATCTVALNKGRP